MDLLHNLTPVLHVIHYITELIIYIRDFIVRALTFEGFKLRSSNFTCALLIQISRTSAMIDIVV